MALQQSLLHHSITEPVTPASASKPLPSRPETQPLNLLTLPPEILNQILRLLLTPSLPAPPTPKPQPNSGLISSFSSTTIHSAVTTPKTAQPESITTPRIIIRSLFIRAHYQNKFMSQSHHPKRITTNILLVCHRLTDLAIPILYSFPLWRAECRLEALASQIGRRNLSCVRRLAIDPDDLGLIVESLDSQNHNTTTTTTTTTGSTTVHQRDEAPWGGAWQRERMNFAGLHHLSVPGYRVTALTGLGTRASQREALKLAEAARRIVNDHPVMGVLIQKYPLGYVRDRAVDHPLSVAGPGEARSDLEALVSQQQRQERELAAGAAEGAGGDGGGGAGVFFSNNNGGSDAIDNSNSMTRVQWRFARDCGDVAEDEFVVDLDELVAFLSFRDIGDERRTLSLERWTDLPWAV